MQKLRGMQDLMGNEAKLYEAIVATASTIAKRYGFEPIATPLLEETGLFARSVGGSSDIVRKEMYNFTDKGDHDVCLRPEGTAGVVRSFIENKFDRQDQSHRFFYHGAMFRYERPQKGRFRQFHQFGCESFGEPSVREDFNIIALIAHIFDELGVQYNIEINSLGCTQCANAFKDDIKKHFAQNTDEFCTDCHERLHKNVLRVFDCKNPKCKTLIEDMPRITDALCTGCTKDFTTLQSLLQNAQIDFMVNKNLVRGLDYYTKSAFEFTYDHQGAQNAIAGGGRYDGLVETLGGRATSGVGFAMGIERLIDLLSHNEPIKGIYLGALDELALDAVCQIGHQKRKSCGVYVALDAKKLKNHLKQADKMQKQYCAIVGDNELQTKSVWIKDLITKQERTITIDTFLSDDFQ